MSAQLADPRQAATAVGPLPPTAVSPHRLPALESRAAAPEAPREAGASENVDRGIGLLLRFLGGISVMVGDVVVVGAIDRSWVLIPAFAVLLLTTAVVFAGIMRLLADGAEGHA
jgi:hypothetical protein